MKFKPGDKVICVVQQFGNETVGKSYTVDDLINFDEDWFNVRADDNGTSNCYPIRNFELAYIKEFSNKLESILNEEEKSI